MGQVYVLWDLLCGGYVGEAVIEEDLRLLHWLVCRVVVLLSRVNAHLRLSVLPLDQAWIRYGVGQIPTILVNDWTFGGE